MCECVPHLVKVGPNDDEVVEVFGGCVVPIGGQDVRCAVITGLALLAKAVAMALIASSPKSPRSSLESLRSVMS